MKSTLLRAGTSLFGEKGYASTSVREIVAIAGVTKPVLYYYFENKEGLFRAILGWAEEAQEQVLNQALETPGTAMQKLIALYRRVYEGVKENQDLYKMIRNLVFGPPQGAPPFDVSKYHRHMVDAIKAIYLEGVSQGELEEGDPEEVALLVLALMDFCIHLDHTFPEMTDPARSERLLRLAFRGLTRNKE